VRAGQVLLHRSFDAHLNQIAPRGARVLNLPLGEEPGFALGVVSDPDGIARLVACDLAAAISAFGQQLRPLAARAADWPDLLAHDLQQNGRLQLRSWARRHRLAPATVSRGFRQVFAISPAAFRGELRSRVALTLITAGATSLATIAASAGFADQAHMTRAITALTTRPPGWWRRWRTTCALSVP
jgi:AraC-like DNA-binding protein